MVWVEASSLPVVGDRVVGALCGSELTAVRVRLVVGIEGYQVVEQGGAAVRAVKVGCGAFGEGDCTLSFLLLYTEIVAAEIAVEVAG